MSNNDNADLPQGGSIDLGGGARVDFGYHISSEGGRGQHWQVFDASGNVVESARDSGVNPRLGYGHRVDQMKDKGDPGRVKYYPKQDR